jgi:hypothetical protein
MERGDGRLLPAMLGRSRGVRACDFADERAVHAQGAGPVANDLWLRANEPLTLRRWRSGLSVIGRLRRRPTIAEEEWRDDTVAA